jgi:curved DNA-binding protein CbpA
LPRLPLARRGRAYQRQLDLGGTWDENCSRMNFIDYYEMLQISPNAQMETINRVYRLLAQRFHPDNPESADTERFLKLQQAYAVLSNPERKAEYDEDRRHYYERPMEVFGMKEFSDGIEGEGNRRMGILCLLYNKRRSSPEEAGMSVLTMETLMALPREHLLFTIWYLRQKQLVEFNFNSEYEITAVGIDLVESKFPKSTVLQKLIAAPAGSKLKPAAVVLENLRKTQ